MKYLLTLLSVSFFLSVPAQRTYVKEWKHIDSLLEKAGLVKTALKEVNIIYKSAKKEKNDVQAIKALIYRMQINDQISDSGRYENLALLEKEISEAREPAKSILHSVAGSSYLSYLQMNRWQLYQRSNTKGYNSKDISTWSLQQLYDRITSHFEKSLANIIMLQGLKLEKFDPIIIKGNARYLRPTLFDLLAFRALDYYRNDERYITKPAYAFEISDSVAFADVPTFIHHKFKTSDSLSLHHRALKVYQQLLSFHINDAKQDALLDANLDRLNFVRHFSTHADKDELYKNALQQLATKFGNEPAITDVLYHLANWYNEKGNRYDPVGDTTNRYAIVKAKELCGKAIAMNVKNEGAVNAGNLLKTILRQEIRMKAEAVNTTGEAFGVLVQYRNVDNAYVRIVKYDRGVREKLGDNSWEKEFWMNAVALPAIKTYNYALPATNDYQLHRVEIKIDPLPAGEYGILVSSDKNFQLSTNAMALQQVYVSDIAYVNNKSGYYVLNRKTGVPLAGAQIQVWEQFYNAATHKQDVRKQESYSTDASGYFALKSQQTDNTGRTILLDIRSRNDRLFIDKPIYNYQYDGDQINTTSIVSETLLFTDRSIYRPGQTVYFKGILINKNPKAKASSVIPNSKSKIFLQDANGQPVDSLNLVTNEFGSYFGKFNVPAGLLTGMFSIRDEATNSTTQFSVEEYKRPKFQVRLAAPTGTCRVNDSVKVEGSATSYAGNTINGATVNYRVTRRATMIYFNYPYRIWPPFPQEQMEIAHGTITTDENGKFSIPFVAIADNKLPRSLHPEFNYTITTDVTDINGETRSAATTVTVAFEALKINLNIPDWLHTDSLDNIDLSTTNLNDSFVRADVKISIQKLNAPEKVFRERYWERPDQFLMTREEYYKSFPYDQYADEMDKSQWQKQNAFIQDSFTTAPGSVYQLRKKIPDAGWYVVEAFTKDKFGDTVSIKKYVLLYNDKLVSPEASVVLAADKGSALPGEKLTYSLISNIGSAQVIHELLRNNETKKDILDIGKKDLTATISINESDRGGVIVKTVFVKNNRVYSDVLSAGVPFLNKQLKIDYTTYRDKTLPGSEEKWKVKISGMKGEKVAAELLTAMYDASLDQFYPHRWSMPALWTGSLDHNAWTGYLNFTSGESVNRNIYEEEENVFVKVYDRLRTNDVVAVEYDRVSIKRFGRGNAKLMARNAAPVKMDAEIKENVLVGQQSEEKEEYLPSSDTIFKKNEVKIIPRKNFRETAFFFPDLTTDSSGNVEFSFTTPEALTTWNWMLLAHTKDLAYAYASRNVITQKQLMVQPNAPRFLREGDSINFSVKVANMSAETIRGKAALQLLDPSTGKNITGLISNNSQEFNFIANAGQSVPLSFSIKIPSLYTQPLTWRVMATAETNDASLSDGEEDIIPVLSNRMLVTETITLPIRNTKSKTFKFDKLINSGASKSLKNKALTVEFTSNPAWYAVQALPYLSEVKDENAEQIFNRFYANALASKLANSFPKLKAVVEQWKTADTSAFLSALQKNQDLKSILLEETPWVLEAKTESQQKKNISLLFGMTSMSNELSSAWNKLISMQSEDGSLVWYKGGPPDRYMTQYILSGIGRLKKLEAISSTYKERIENFSRKSVAYLDQQILKDYNNLKQKNKKIISSFPAVEPIQYLYMRSFFTDIPFPANIKPAHSYFVNKVKQDWVKQNTFMRAMIALTLQRTGDAATAKKIVAALKESAIENDELGMYWKDMTGGYYWYQAPVETQSIVIEAFHEITKDDEAVGNLKTWLLKNKQTNSWPTTRATADACYALLLDGGSWIEDDASAAVKLGNQTVSSDKAAPGTGYFRKTFDGDAIKPAMGKITVNRQTGNTSRPSWGGVYWQYFEDLDKITTAATSLRIDKKLFVQKNTDRGPVIEVPDNGNSFHVGDRVKVRIEIRTDRNMEYVHLKDMRSPAMEPVNVLSEYKWQDGLGYYESTKDASTHFFFSFLPKGTYVFEYDLFVTHTGSFSNGVATIQCMYAPEFSSHSEGIKVNVVK